MTATTLSPAPSSPDARQDIRTIGLIGLGHCTSHFHHMLLPPLFPVFIREFGLQLCASWGCC
jgi:FSR family fosmidomycin resistance protein-like MFS transporter